MMVALSIFWLIFVDVFKNILTYCPVIRYSSPIWNIYYLHDSVLVASNVIFQRHIACELFIQVLTSQFLYKFNKFILFSLYNMFRLFIAIIGQIILHEDSNFSAVTLLHWAMFTFFEGKIICVIYSTNALCTSYASWKYVMLNLILVLN